MTEDVVAYFNQQTGTNLTPIFDQYLRHRAIPVLELRFDAGTELTSAEKIRAAGIGDRTEVLAARLLCSTDDGEAALGAVHRLGISPVHTVVRRSTLEDVFLSLTGRTLVD